MNEFNIDKIIDSIRKIDSLKSMILSVSDFVNDITLDHAIIFDFNKAYLTTLFDKDKVNFDLHLLIAMHRIYNLVKPYNIHNSKFLGLQLIIL